MSNKAVFKEAFNMLCGEKLGAGTARTVYDCRIRDDLVVKVENADYRMFQNVTEMKFWTEWQEHTPVAKWLAPCAYLSPDGRILLQKKCTPLTRGHAEVPEKLPSFFTDTKYANFGLLDGRVVCLDYAFVITEVKKRLRKVEWWGG